MKPATLAQIKKELNMRSSDELLQLCLRLGRFKKENKELLTYLLFEAEDDFSLTDFADVNDFLVDSDEENDEYLTDFMAITYGFGVFLGNSRFSFSKFSNSGMSGWQSSSQGYLPEQVIAYAVASLSIQRNEKTNYSQFFNKSMKKYFDQSIAFLKEEKSKN